MFPYYLAYQNTAPDLSPVGCMLYAAGCLFTIFLFPSFIRFILLSQCKSILILCAGLTSMCSYGYTTGILHIVPLVIFKVHPITDSFSHYCTLLKEKDIAQHLWCCFYQNTLMLYLPKHSASSCCFYRWIGVLQLNLLSSRYKNWVKY